MPGTEGGGEGADEGIRQVDWIYHGYRGSGRMERYIMPIKHTNNRLFIFIPVILLAWVGMYRLPGHPLREKLRIRTHTPSESI